MIAAHRVKQVLFLFLVPFILWSSQACGAIQTGPTPTPTPTLSAQEIALRSSQAMLEVESMQFDILLSGGLAYIDRPPTTALKRVEGELNLPDEMRALVRISSLGLVSEIGLISIAGTSYVTNPVNQRWEMLPPDWGWFFNPALPFDETYGIPAVVPHVQMEKIGLETSDGKTFYHLRGVAQGEQIRGWTANLMTEGEVPVDLWIDTETFLIHRVHMVELAGKPENPTEWDITFSEFNQPVEIQAPPLTQ